MNPRLAVFVFVALFAVSAFATEAEWSPADDELFSPLPTLPTTTTTTHTETPNGIVATQTAPVHAVVDIPEPKPVVVVAHAPEPEVKVIAVNHSAPVEAPQATVVVHSIDAVPVAVPAQQSVSDLQFAYSRSRKAAKRAVRQARTLADAAAQSQRDLQAATDRKNALLSTQKTTHEAIRKLVDEVSRAMDDNNAPIDELETKLKEMKRTAKDIKRRLEVANRQYAEAVAKAEADKRNALQSLADAERIAREKRINKRKAAEAARLERRRKAAEDRKKQHEEAIKTIVGNATQAIHSAKVAADSDSLTADLEATTKAARDLAHRIMERRHAQAVRVKRRLERKLAKARKEVERLNSKVSTFLVPPLPTGQQQQQQQPVGIAVVNGQVAGTIVAHPSGPQPVAIVTGGQQLTGAHVIYTN